MLRNRVIPALLLHNQSLVKTKKFKDYVYVGDPANTVRIFNELEVDELIFLDINASIENRGPNLKLLREIADECFMPLAYGGGIKTIEQAKEVFNIGFEKIAINYQAINNPKIVSDFSHHFGSQSVIVSIDVKKKYFGKKTVYSLGGKKNMKYDPVEWAKKIEKLGAGEILLTSIDREGTWKGFDLELIESVTNAVSIPVIAHGGAGKIRDIELALDKSGASAVALGSMVIFQDKNKGVLVHFDNELREFYT